MLATRGAVVTHLRGCRRFCGRPRSVADQLVTVVRSLPGRSPPSKPAPTAPPTPQPRLLPRPAAVSGMRRCAVARQPTAWREVPPQLPVHGRGRACWGHHEASGARAAVGTRDYQAARKQARLKASPTSAVCLISGSRQAHGLGAPCTPRPRAGTGRARVRRKWPEWTGQPSTSGWWAVSSGRSWRWWNSSADRPAEPRIRHRFTRP